MKIVFNRKYENITEDKTIDLITDDMGTSTIEVAYIQVLSGGIEIKGTIHDDEEPQLIGAICLNNMKVVENLEAGKIYIIDTNGLSSITLVPAVGGDAVSVQIKALV